MQNCSSMDVTFLPSSSHPCRLHYVPHSRCLRHIYHTKIGRSRWEAQLGGEDFWVQDAACGCALLLVPSRSWTIQAKQKDCMNSHCHKGELGLHYLVELMMKHSISAHPKTPEQSTNQSLAISLLLRSKKSVVCLCNSFSQLMRGGPRGKRKHFPGKKLLTSEGRKPNSAPCASALNAAFSCASLLEGAQCPACPRWEGRKQTLYWMLGTVSYHLASRTVISKSGQSNYQTISFWFGNDLNT